MKHAVLLVATALMLAADASAQEEAGTTAAAEAAAEPAPAPASAPAPAEKEKKRSAYYKRVKGFLWIEALVGPTSYDPDQFGRLDLEGTSLNAPKVQGPEYGFAALLGLGGFGIGAFYRQANYDDYNLMKVGIDIQGTFRFIPYVHPMVRIDLFYGRTFNGNPYGLSNTDVDGGGVTLGAGVRIPIIRWISFAATFEWTAIGLAVRGDTATGSFKSGIAGQQLGGIFALTFHFIGVRRDD